MNRSTEVDLVQGGHRIDPGTGAVVPPIHPSTTYARDENYDLISDYLYTRHGAPNHVPVEDLAARLDRGVDARVFASGLAAFTALVETVPHGAGVVAPQVMYHGGQLWLRRLHGQGRINLVLFDQTEPGAMEAAIESYRPDLVWIETPVNPTWDVIDIRAAVAATKSVGGHLAVDATVSPLTTRPIELGADFTFHSATKFYNGHADLLGGLLISASESDRWEQVKWIRTHTGAVMGAFEAWLLLRGMKTLYLRVDRASDSAMSIARHFEKHSAVESVLYPGLESHPGHEVAAKQMDRGFGAMMSIRVKGGFDAAHQVAVSTRVFIPATSLGGVESLIEHRMVLEPPESVVPGDLLRLSIGIEPVDDLIADLEQALGNG
ncbi:MAG TPA: PLP-dependent aspartate aminotransferase family protein [Acidimicrobiia bacterium]